MPDTQILSDEEVEEIEARASVLPSGWVVPEKDKAEHWRHIYCRVELTAAPEFRIQVTPTTVGDIPVAEFIAHVTEDIHALCHAVRALRAGARARNILLLELGGRGELLAKEHVNPDALDGLVAVRNEFDRLRNLLIPNLESQLATAEQERDRFATLAAENAHLNERLGIQEGHCKRLQEELTRAAREVK